MNFGLDQLGRVVVKSQRCPEWLRAAHTPTWAPSSAQVLSREIGRHNRVGAYLNGTIFIRDNLNFFGKFFRPVLRYFQVEDAFFMLRSWNNVTESCKGLDAVCRWILPTLLNDSPKLESRHTELRPDVHERIQEAYYGIRSEVERDSFVSMLRSKLTWYPSTIEQISHDIIEVLQVYGGTQGDSPLVVGKQCVEVDRSDIKKLLYEERIAVAAFGMTGWDMKDSSTSSTLDSHFLAALWETARELRENEKLERTSSWFAKLAYDCQAFNFDLSECETFVVLQDIVDDRSILTPAPKQPRFLKDGDVVDLLQNSEWKLQAIIYSKVRVMFSPCDRKSKEEGEQSQKRPKEKTNKVPRTCQEEQASHNDMRVLKHFVQLSATANVIDGLTSDFRITEWRSSPVHVDLFSTAKNEVQ
eukprot:CAMPEP_0184481868 /NCGR_PEP_ID=MMETSP0113_2-20130426/3452_1 /TAXON_ID=91329 /ORGANISM="Norrisiella sphaerica, Strain BC52" /LENGTH=413 /DNA_ID=CAMNT_0026861281 /DNA_START=38 /DNA_END=1279 /DNA_ORIENTATION=-